MAAAKLFLKIKIISLVWIQNWEVNRGCSFEGVIGWWVASLRSPQVLPAAAGSWFESALCPPTSPDHHRHLNEQTSAWVFCPTPHFLRGL